MNKWKYECDCKNCSKVEYVNDPKRHRNGLYCIPGIEGKKTVHADDDYVVRCNHYTPKSTQLTLF